ncbi:MAG: hypothetical protein EKK51_16420 [Mycolicibacterium sp.]|nr:MAG: hypothetical protein EKK51_16420 [Mycolicibacterium sp.]
MNVGDRVRIERDENLYPSRGTWPEFRGKRGTIVELNHGEYGVCFGKVTPAPPSHRRAFNWDAKNVVWFQPYELVPISAGRASGSQADDYALAA